MTRRPCAFLAIAEPGDAEFVASALREAGFDLATDAGEEVTTHVVADPEWTRNNRHLARPDQRWLVVAHAQVLLDGAFPDDIRTLVLPCSRDVFLHALLSPEAPTTGARRPFDWSAHDRALDRAGIDHAAMPALDAIAQLVATALGVPTAAVTFVTSERQRLIGHVGASETVRDVKGIPRSWSHCQHVVASGAPLVAGDVHAYPELARSPLTDVADTIRGYAGVPVADPAAGWIGAVCAISPVPRCFSERDLAVLRLAARAVELELAARAPRAQLGVLDGPTIPAPRAVPFVRMTRPDAEPPPPPATAGEDLLGRTLDDKYAVVGRLGAGGMSRVYLARDVLLGSPVAVKVLDAAFSEDTLVREAKALVAIRHPSIVRLLSWGRVSKTGPIFLALDYIRGTSLRSWLADTWLTNNGPQPEQTCEILRQLGGALDTLHGAGFVHGDVKPENVILDASLFRAMLIDFGLAVPIRGDALVRGGSVGYSAPEQFGDPGAAPKPALDVYSLAALGYAMLCGRPPFGKGPADVRIEAQRSGDFTPCSVVRPELGLRLDRVFQAALSPDIARRPTSVSALVDEIERALHTSDAEPLTRQAPSTKALAMVDTRKNVIEHLGAEAELAMVATLPELVRAAVEDTTPVGFVDTTVFVTYIRAACANDADLLEILAHRVFDEHAAAAVARLQIARTPFALVRATEVLFHRVHRFGVFQFEQPRSDRARIELVMPEFCAPILCSYLRVIAERMLAMSGYRSSVRHDTCTATGADRCVFEVAWSG